MKKTIFTLLICLFFANLTNAQAIEILNEKISVNSIGAITGNTRNFAEIKLPEGVVGYFYRITVVEKGGQSPVNSLISLVENIPTTESQLTSAAAKMAIRSTNGNAIDFFIFNNLADVNAFLAKSDGEWSFCKSFPNRINTCQITDECMGGGTFWFGFRNNNVSDGLDVYIEVTAIK